MTTFDRVRRVLIEEVGVDAHIEPLCTLSHIGIDSLEMSQLMLELEDEFGIEIPDDDMQKIFTVQDIVNYADTRSH
jgi:acyl carrier protein